MIFAVEVDRKMRVLETMVGCAASLAAASGKTEAFSNLMDEYIGTAVPEDRMRKQSFIDQASTQMNQVSGKVFKISRSKRGVLAKMIEESEAMDIISRRNEKKREAFEKKQEAIQKQHEERRKWQH
jgi:hypothetical protein